MHIHTLSVTSGIKGSRVGLLCLALQVGLIGGAAPQSALRSPTTGGENAFPLHEFWRDSDRGLELSRAEDSLLVADYKGVPIVIQGVGQEAKDLGLTELRLWNRVEFRLLEAGLRPAELPPGPNQRFLHLELAADEDAFSLTLSFVRKVYFDNDGVFYTEMAEVWSETAFGAHEGSELEVVEQLDALLGAFLRSYLLVNAP